MRDSQVKTTIYCVLALLCFAANSVLCRLALGKELIDAGSFTVVRLTSGIVCLAFILFVALPNKSVESGRGSWLSGLALFLYAVTFSFAYLSLDTGTGALILFGSVQLTMLAWQYAHGKRPGVLEWAGVLLAFSGLVYLVYPILSTPRTTGLVLMAAAGCAWGVYTLRGKSSQHPLADTAFNFFRTLPMVLILAALAWPRLELTAEGLFYAVLSGALASGVGYSLWYVALENLTATVAAVTQLSVPVLAAIGGVLMLGELLDARLFLATLLVLGGIGLVIHQNRTR